jgi:hypothetical protein
MTDNGSPQWHLALTEIANQMNAQLHSSLKTSPWEVVFRQKKPINWLTAQERREAEGIEVEGGGIITEESLSKELEGEEDEEVLAGFREIREFLNIQVPAPASTIRVKERVPGAAKQPNQPVSPPKQLQTTPRGSRTVPLLTEPSMQPPKKSSPKKSIFTKKSTPPLALTESRTDLDEPEIVTILSKPFGTLGDKYPAGRPVA